VTLASVTHRVPRQIIAGDSIEFLVAVPADYLAWTGSARLTGPGQMSATSVALENSDLRVRFAGQASGSSGTYKTAQLKPGQYTLTVWLTSGADRVTLLQTQLTITADLSTGTPAEPHCVVMLRMIEEAIQARLDPESGNAIDSYSVDGTAVTKMSLEELERKRNKYAAEVQALQNPNGQIPRVKFAFTQPGAPVDVRRRFG
jgi:hypothetical protein